MESATSARVRVALVHDFLVQFGGGERVLLEISRLYPNAPIYTSIYAPDVYGGAFAGKDVRTTWLSRLPGARRHFRSLLLLYPSAFELLDFRGFDVVISSTTSFAKGVRVPAGTLHVCYMNTPTRFLWNRDEYASGVVPPLLRPLYAAAIPALRRWDLKAAARPHRIIANSRNVAERIRSAYGRESDVLHCPASIDGFNAGGAAGDYYLVAARLLRYKRIDLAIEACNALAAPLVIMGGGPDEARLRAIAGPTVRFAGHVSDDERIGLFERARAVIVPGIEDFGLVPIEAAAAGKPSVAFAAGGALETIVEGETGVFFREASADALVRALQALHPGAFDPEKLAAHARTFSPERFRAGLGALIDRYRTEFLTT
jgi:glycosyltransferase involved in cell wall biosynthesis